MEVDERATTIVHEDCNGEQTNNQESDDRSVPPLAINSGRNSEVPIPDDTNAEYSGGEALEKFERMIDRFHLRRVPSRLPAKRSSLHRKLSDVPPIAEQDSQDRPSVDSSDRSSQIPHFVSKVSSGRVQIPPPDRATNFRLASTSLALLVSILYRPFAQAYGSDRTWLWCFDVFVWFVFAVNYLVLRIHGHQLRKLLPDKSRINRQKGLRRALIAALPITLVTQLIHSNPTWQWLPITIQFLARYVSVRFQQAVFVSKWARDAVSAESGMLGAIFFSRYGYLLRIASSILAMVMFAHFIACVWSSLQPLSVFDAFDSAFDMHLHSIYEALQLLQGQGVTTKTPLQDAFGSIAVLIGSVVLAVVFGDVAVLVANFSANQTTYQRKRERVLATMDKLQLPAPLRERIHQYYEYLHAEYESLDGEVATFTKELSHTLQLEVVLFKYMDVVTHVSHWSECSADFQKQLVLAVSVRVYLPDDFIMRRGEVGVDCFVVSRGTCKQYAYEDGNWEQATLPPQLSGDQRPRRRRTSRIRRPSKGGFSMDKTKAAEGPHSRFSISGFVMTDRDADPNSPYTSVKVLSRGQSIGAMALICNYERTTDLRAVSYVEMCVLDRVAFQRVLSQFPDDREIVLTKMVQHHVLTMELSGSSSFLIDAVRAVKPSATVHTCVKMLVRAINPKHSDPTLTFGLNRSFDEYLGSQRKTATHSQASPAGASSDRTTRDSTPRPASVFSDMLVMIQGIQRTLESYEARIAHLSGEHSSNDIANGFSQEG